MGLDVFLYSKAQHESEEYSHEDVPSIKHPGHLFNRRYLRSSYSSGGFNSAVPDFIGEDSSLYWIFEGLGADEYDVALTAESVPLLEQAKERAQSVVQRLKTCDRLRAEAMGQPITGGAAHQWSELPSSEAVLDWYREEVKREAPFSSYSSAKGIVFREGFTVLAITMGKGILGEASPVVVYRAEPETVDSYIASAEIVAEFCDEALALIERDGSAYIGWSG